MDGLGRFVMWIRAWILNVAPMGTAARARAHAHLVGGAAAAINRRAVTKHRAMAMGAAWQTALITLALATGQKHSSAMVF
jgi:hypothetical protein